MTTDGQTITSLELEDRRFPPPACFAAQANAQPVAWAVKPLEWRRGYCDERVTIEQASSEGLYQVRALDGEVWLDAARQATRYATAEAAKAAAQADYDQRIRSALHPAPSQVTDEMVRKRTIEFLLHRGEQPMRVTRRGAELWEEYAPAIRAALTAALGAKPEVKP